MTNVIYKNMVSNLLDLVRDGLGPYMISVYQEKNPKSYAADLRKVIGNMAYQIPQSAYANSLLLANKLDTYAVLRLITQAPKIVQDDLNAKLGSEFMSTSDRLYEYRNKQAHETKGSRITLWDAILVADLTVYVLESVCKRELSTQAQRIQTELKDLSDEQLKPMFSASIQKISETIKQLTEQQLNVLTELLGKKKVAVIGCAGSGKTLIAIETATRMVQAGAKTLILCRNPRLAKWIRNIVKETGVDVSDFNGWVARLLNDSTEALEWSQYDTPTDDQILMACEKLKDSNKQYDAIIIDEGQDFSEEWWLLIDEALRAPKETARLYIFYDDNQMLVPRLLKYPVTMAEHTLNQNCRNAGKIFEFVARYLPQPSSPNEKLKNTGYLYPFKLNNFSHTETHTKIKDAFLHSQAYLPISSLVFITTEDVPSIINGVTLPVNIKWDWQAIIGAYFHGIVPHPEKINMIEQFKALDQTLNRNKVGKITSDTWLPTQCEQDLVVNLAQTARERLEKIPSNQSNDFDWDMYSQKHTSAYTPHDRKYIDYFCSTTWNKDLSKQCSFVIGQTVPIYTIAEYKGLEADGVILFIHQKITAAWNTAIYVGASRAKYLLCVVSDELNIH